MLARTCRAPSLTYTNETNSRPYEQTTKLHEVRNESRGRSHDGCNDRERRSGETEARAASACGVEVSHLEGVKPQPLIYVKCFARMKDGTVKFYKDGYADHRLRFDYATLSTDELDQVDRFAILVLSDTLGAVVREAVPPRR